MNKMFSNPLKMNKIKINTNLCTHFMSFYDIYIYHDINMNVKFVSENKFFRVKITIKSHKKTATQTVYAV